MANSSSSPQPTVLVFDWGDTVMENFPQYSGRMVDWPETAPVEGIAAALETLKPRYRLLMATNALDSDASQVRAALSRVGLDGYFEVVFTGHEISGRKPDLGFFRSIERLTGERPENLVMVGDSYQNDILGARQAGWFALWYNPLFRPAPALFPLQNGDIYRMETLPSCLLSLDLPSPQDCFNWILQEGGSHNLWLHIQSVASIAYQLALWLRAAGQEVDPLLTHRGGLLHDLAKISANKPENSPLNHGELAARLLEARHQPVLAKIVHRHLLYCLLDEVDRPSTWEQKLVHYADKIAEGARLVTLEQRIAALQQRYESEREYIQNCLPSLRVLQDEICQALAVSPETLHTRLAKSLRET